MPTTGHHYAPGVLTCGDTDRIISDGHAQRRVVNPDTQRTQHTTGSRMSTTSVDAAPLALTPTRNTSRNSSRFGALPEGRDATQPSGKPGASICKHLLAVKSVTSILF